MKNNIISCIVNLKFHDVLPPKCLKKLVTDEIRLALWIEDNKPLLALIGDWVVVSIGIWSLLGSVSHSSLSLNGIFGIKFNSKSSVSHLTNISSSNAIISVG